MSRALALAAVLCAGCGTPSSTVDRHVEGLASQALTIRVLLTEVTGSYPGIVVHATVMSRTAEWAGLRDLEVGGRGPARRLTDGIAELETEHLYLPDEEWVTDGELERRYAIVLDAPPTEPWDVVVSVTIDGSPTGMANAEIVIEP